MGLDIHGKTTSGQTCVDDGFLLSQNIVENISSAVFIFQGEKMCYVNPAAISITGYSKEELLVMPFWAIIHEDFQDMVKQRGRSRQAGDDVPDHYELKIVRKDGEYRWVNFRASMIELDGKPAVLGLAEEITERKQVEAGLQETRNVFERLADYTAMTASLSADAVIQNTLALLHDVFVPHESSIALIQTDQNSFCLTASSHREQLELGKGILIPFHATVLSEVILSQEPRYRPDIAAEHSIYEVDKQLLGNGFRSDFLVPLWVEKQCLGTLNMVRSEIDAFSRRERELIALIASRLAQTLHNASLFQALCESEQQYRTLVEDSPDMIHSLDARGRITSANTAEMETMGYSAEEYMGKSALDIVHPDYLEATKSALASVLAGQTINKYETSLVTKAGEKIDVEVSATPQTVDGKVVATRAIMRDITERKQAEELLKESEAQLSRIYQSVGDVLYYLSVEDDDCYRFASVNQVFLDATGLTKEQIVGKCIEEVIPELAVGMVRNNYKKAIRENRIIRWEETSVFPAGKKIGEVSIAPVFNAKGICTNLVGSVHDITERVQAELALYESEKKYRGMVMNLMEGFYRVTLDGKLQNYNIAFTKILGLDLNNDYTGIELPIFWQNPEGRKDYASEIKTHGFIKNYTVHAKKLNGEKIILQINARLIKGENSNPLLIEGSFLDITERKRAEEALHDSRARLAEAQRIGHMGNWEFDVILNTGLYSDETYRIFGVAADYGRSFKSFFRLVHPDDRWLVKQANHKAFETGGFSNVQYRIIHPDGCVHFVQASGEGHRNKSGRPYRIFGTIQDITERTQAEAQVRKLSNALTCAGSSIMITNRAGVIEYVNPAFTKITGYSAGDAMGQTPRILNSGYQDAAFYEHLWLTITRGDIWHGKVIDKRKDGSLFPSMLTIAPIVDDQSVITHFVGSHADISELEDMEAQFHQAQKMEAIGTLVGGIAHDFNNLLASMTGNLYLAKMKVQAQPDVVKKLDNVEQLSIRAADMIQQLLTFARKDRVSMKALPFTSFIKETLKFLKTSVPENISLHQEICSEDLLLNGDGTQLHQVLMNLINNARDAVEHVHEPRITTRLAIFHANDGWLEHHAYFTAGAYAHLNVEDNGCGIPEQQIEHLFEPFFTTKEVGKGTGLGLAMVFGAVKTHHGFVEVDSAPGEGSTFHIYIPLLEQENSMTASLQPLEVADGHGEMILLADDEIHILETGKEVLEALGYQVLMAINGQQAMEIFEAHPEAIDLCLFDIVMPILGGDEAANQIRQVKPDAKIIFATGYDKNLQHHLAGEMVLSKPFSIVEMSQLIRQQLDA